MPDNNDMRAGFTLSELLIALAILGVISAFTIPKILQAQQDQKKRAIIRETYSILADITQQGWMTGQMIKTNKASYVMDRINAIKVCKTDSTAQGCAPPAATESGWLTQRGLVLPNGAVVISDNDGNAGDATCSPIEFFIDWNGATGPNTAGNDQLALEFNCDAKTVDSWTGNRPGVLRTDYWSGSWPAYEVLYYDVFGKP